MMRRQLDRNRRNFLRDGGVVAVAGIFAPAIITGRAMAEESGKMSENEEREADTEPGEEVTPPEDLMREHGVLDRVMLVYEAVMAKFGSGEDFDPAVLTSSAAIVREFIEDYHEKLEEDYVFPRFKKAGEMVELVDTLLAQHQAGRRVTDVVLQHAPAIKKDDTARRRTTDAIQAFIVMYRPHAAREDTALFPKLKELVSSNEYDAMAEEFEEKEHALFGDDGFDKMVYRVATLERSVGIYDLNQYTPQ